VSWTPDYGGYALRYDPAVAYEPLGFLTGVEVAWADGRYHLFYSAWGTEAIPDPSAYFCPDQNGGLISAVLTVNRATRYPGRC
jgi:hypothetical protein